MRARRRILVSLFVALLATAGLLVGSAGPSAAQAPPQANDDRISVSSALFPIMLDVLANDTDPDGDPLTVVSASTITSHGSTVNLVGGAGDVEYTPGPGVAPYDYLVYEISDGNGGTDTAIVSVFLDVPVPTPPALQIDPPVIDFGAVPLGTNPAVQLTITNVGTTTIAPLIFDSPQRAPEPFEWAADDGSICRSQPLAPGDACQQSVVFWSVPDAEDASPAVLQITSNQSGFVTTVPLYAAPPTPAVPPPPNAPPLARDEADFVEQPFARTLDPTRNDDDGDDDQLTITTFNDPAHGTAVPESCRAVGSGRSPYASCLNYTPDPGFDGVDVVDYTISDGRGGTDSAVMYVVVRSDPQQPITRVDSITPDHGPPAGGHSATVTGGTFLPGSQVEFRCGASFHLANTTFVSYTQLTITVPSMPPATCDVLVISDLLHSTGELFDGYTIDSGVVPRIVPGGGTIVEGNTGTKTLNIPVTLSAASSLPVSAEWNTVHVNAGNEHEAKPGDDYVAASGVVAFAPGQTSANVPLTIKGDGLDEYDELILVAFHNPMNATLGGFFGAGFGSITDDDALPVVVPDWAVLDTIEGNSGSHPVALHARLSAPSGRTITMHFSMPFAGGNGIAEPDDYGRPLGFDVTLHPGDNDLQILVAVFGDTVPEEDELVGGIFSNPTNVRIGGVFGIASFRILNDD